MSNNSLVRLFAFLVRLAGTFVQLDQTFADKPIFKAFQH